MTELDQVWSEMIKKAAVKAVDSGRQDIADYLRLKAANDAIRSVGVNWLLDTFVEIAGHESRKHKSITIEREEPHNFARGNSNIVGSLLTVRYGVRCLTVEAGWTRTPSDGIMSGKALAVAHIKHFGLPKMGAEFRFIHGETLPNWVSKADEIIDSGELRRHFDVLLDK